MKKLLILPLFLALTLIGYAQNPKPSLNYTSAEIIIKGAIEYAEANNIKVAISIYDDGGNLVAFAKMDGASQGASKVSQWKGESAAAYQVATSQSGAWNVPEAPAIATIAGGLPIKTKDGICIGGLGVSGAAKEVDVQCAIAGLKKAGLYFDEVKK